MLGFKKAANKHPDIKLSGSLSFQSIMIPSCSYDDVGRGKVPNYHELRRIQESESMLRFAQGIEFEEKGDKKKYGYKWDNYA